MKEQIEKLKEVYRFAPGSGYVQTNLEAVQFFWSTEAVERAPLIYRAGIVVILQGEKTGFLGDQVFHYNPDSYLVLSVPIPFECETSASPDNPMLGIFINFDPAALSELVRLMDAEGAPQENGTSFGVNPVKIDPEMRDSLSRMLEILCSPLKSKALGEGAVREILFHALSGPHGAALRALTRNDSSSERISRAIRIIREHYDNDLNIDHLAGEAGMSPSIFHRNFKALTGSTPHQYLKHTRLHRAKGFILDDKLPIGEAARRVGYDDPGYFSKEFKKYFKVSPKAAQSSSYIIIDI